MKKLLTIIKSRFKKEETTQQVKDRREVCKGCEFNSKNVDNIPFRKLIWKKLSDFYSLLCGTLDEDNLGNCLACNSCSLYYSTKEPEESCKKNKWKE